MKAMLFLALMILITACAPSSTPASPTAPARQVPTALPTPTARKSPPAPSTTASPSATDTAAIPITGETATPGQTSPACFALIRPANGENVSDVEQVPFEWDRQNEAQYYVFTLTSPTGLRENTRTTATKLTRSVPKTSQPGFYEWSVSAYDSEDQLICNSDASKFSRSAEETGQQTPGATVQPTKTQIVTATAIVPPVPPATPTAPPQPTKTEIVTATAIVPPVPPASPTSPPQPTATAIVPPSPPPPPPPPTDTKPPSPTDTPFQ